MCRKVCKYKMCGEWFCEQGLSGWIMCRERFVSRVATLRCVTDVHPTCTYGHTMQHVGWSIVISWVLHVTKHGDQGTTYREQRSPPVLIYLGCVCHTTSKMWKSMFVAVLSLPCSVAQQQINATATKQFWFQRGVSRDDADNLLDGRPIGTFLVRESRSAKGESCVTRHLPQYFADWEAWGCGHCSSQKASFIPTKIQVAPISVR